MMPDGILVLTASRSDFGICRPHDGCLENIAGREQPAASWETERFNAPDENEQQCLILHFICRLAGTHQLHWYLFDS